MRAAEMVMDSATEWRWPIDRSRYDRDATLSTTELTALHALGASARRRTADAAARPLWSALTRLSTPLDHALDAMWCGDSVHYRRGASDAADLILGRCAETGTTFWAWPEQDWTLLIGTAERWSQRPRRDDVRARPYLTCYAYLLAGYTDFSGQQQPVARRVFGPAPIEQAVASVGKVLSTWGYRLGTSEDRRLPTLLCQMFLLNRSPRLADLTEDVFAQLRAHAVMRPAHLRTLHAVQRAVAQLGHCGPPPTPNPGSRTVIGGTAPAWAEWVERWAATSTLTPDVRGIVRGHMAKAGRWLACEYPDITEPDQWTRQTCAAWIATVDRLNVGDYVQTTAGLSQRVGRPLKPRSKAAIIDSTRTFFRDLQEWEWIRRRFDPLRALRVPTTISRLIGPDPRVIADDVWAKLLWAGLNLEDRDLPDAVSGPRYPVELIRAFTLTWLFAGQRSDEIARLRVGCIRWHNQPGHPEVNAPAPTLAGDVVCLLDIPAHKTGTAFTKPVDPLLGEAMQAWQAIRPDQPHMLDAKTGEQVDFLFAYRARRFGKTYINDTIIPALCRKAGVPAADVRGNITSHRARSTIASQLYNAKEPMTLFELQAWLGHRSPEATQCYAKIAPTTLARAYTDAGYFARNVRAIEVLIDRDAIVSGTAAAGEPWQHYDLGHGYCSYTFFEQCAHRMACVRCDFYLPKDSARTQLLEAKTNLQRMLAEIPLTDDERAVVDDDHTALDGLIARLVDVRTPAGPTPRQLGALKLLPLAVVNRSETAQNSEN